MKPVVARRIRRVGFLLCGLALVFVGLVAWGWHRLQQSLPPLAGERTLAGLSERATLSRDERGTAIVRTANATDAARLLGFAHGQDRFFQMDLLRRHAAGELSELFGAALVDVDRSTRVHRFRQLASAALEREPAHRREQLAAYVEGVNAGLASLSGRPWEYLVLRATPEPWTPADTFLVLYAMALELQDSTGRFEQALATVRNQLGPRAVDFFNPLVGPDDGALDDSSAPLVEIPPPRVLNLRQAAAPEGSQPTSHRRSPEHRGQTSWQTLLAATDPENDGWAERVAPGSNAFAVTGSRTTTGAGLVAGDPHLTLRVPNTWYRAQLEWSTTDGRDVRVVGLSLPGAPGIIIGSNGHVAWSFTNTYVDTGDLVLIDRDPVAPDLVYHRGNDILEFERHTDVIDVKGGDPVSVESTWTIWGPIVARTSRNRQLAHRWTMYDPAAANQEIQEFATARTIEEFISIAHRCGMPPQNVLVVDHEGGAAWTIAGRIPKRFGFDGRFPVTWTYGDRGWDGFLSSSEVPVLRAAPGATIWSANQRHLGGDALAVLGEAGYYEGHRATQIRDGLRQLVGDEATRVQPPDLLAIQLDDRGLWLKPWRDVLVATLDDDAVADHPRRAEFRQLLLAETGELRAQPRSVAYRLTREWHDRLKTLTLTPIFARCVAVDPEFNYNVLRVDHAFRALHREEPRHLLGSAYESWRELRLAAVDAVIARLDDRGVKLSEATWGERNRAAIRHPLSSSLPGFLARWLDLPAQPLAGDNGVPRVQRPSFGVSARIIVAPGHEEDGVLHLPGGQSGHPFSPYYRAGHAAWTTGERLPLLAGEAEHTLTFTP